MEYYIAAILFIFVFIVIGALTGILIWIFKSPFEYPYKIIDLDISGKRAPKDEDLVDQYIIDHGFLGFSEHVNYVHNWKRNCKCQILKGKLKRIRLRQYMDCLDDEHMFQFDVIRTQTRYQQEDYIRRPYYVQVLVRQFSSGFAELQERYEQLKEIQFECTLSEYFSANQRKRMTKALREQIAQRDHYTCQICGKYMPDGVGLHIDHIVPIAKGGKSVPSNLQVLCSKCNGKKSDKEI